MPRPGVTVTIVDDIPLGAAALNTGSAFMAGEAERGPVGTALKVTNMKEYTTAYGPRVGGSLLHDSVSAFFSEAGSGDLYISRVSGDGAVAASGDLGTSLGVEAASPGAWGNNLKVTSNDSVEPAGSFVLTIVAGSTTVEVTPAFATTDAAVTWADEFSEFVKLTMLSADLPADAATVTLTGGVNDDVWNAENVTAALEAFVHELGPGQVLIPGVSSDFAHEGLLAHADQHRRCALLDAPDTADRPTLAALVMGFYGTAGARYASLWGPYAVYPASTPPATVLVPYSAVEAGIIARVDRAGNPNAPAAGSDGVARLATGLSQTFKDDDREALNDLGVDLAKVVYGQVRSYGYRTVAGPLDGNWLWFSNSRTLMAIGWECEAVCETYVLKQIDGRGQIFSRLNKDLRGVCARYYGMNALYGETPSEAYDVVTDGSVNTVDTIKRGEIHAVVKVKTSPAAEWVVLEIVKVQLDRPVSVAAAA